MAQTQSNPRSPDAYTGSDPTQVERSVDFPNLNFSTLVGSESLKTLMLLSGVCESTSVPNMPVASKYLLHRCINIFQRYINGLLVS